MSTGLLIATMPGVSAGEIIKAARETREWSQAELGKRAGGINKETINRIEAGENTTTDTLSQIAAALELSLSDFFPRSEITIEDTDVGAGYEPDAIPVIAEGQGTPDGLRWTTEIIRDLVIERLSRPYDVKDKDAFGILVTGDSMTPVYKAGHRVVVSPNTPVESGDEVYVQLVDGRRLIKIAQRIAGGWRLESANPQYDPIEVKEAEIVAIYPIVWSKRKKPGFRTLDEYTGRRMPPKKSGRR